MQGKQLTKYNLEYCFSQALNSSAKYIGVMIQVPHATAPEVIINPRSNFPAKLKYYSENYNENLEHNHDSRVKIIGLTYGDDFDEIENDFLDY